MPSSRLGEIFREFFPHTIYAVIVFFSLLGIIFVQGFILAQNSGAAPVILSISALKDIYGNSVYFTLKGQNFTKNSVARLNGVNQDTTFKSETELLVVVPQSELPLKANLSWAVANYPDLRTLSVKGSNFLVDSVVRIDGKPVPTTFKGPNELSADLSGIAAGDHQLTVFTSATKVESTPRTITIPETNKPISPRTAKTILDLASSLGIDAAAAPSPDDPSSAKFYDQLAGKVLDQQAISTAKNKALDLASRTGVAVGVLPQAGSPGELNFYKALESRAQKKLDFITLKSDALALLDFTNLPVGRLPADDDPGASAFYKTQKQRAQDRVRVVEIVRAGLFDRAGKANVSYGALPEPGSAGELNFYLDIESKVKDAERRMGR